MNEADGEEIDATVNVDVDAEVLNDGEEVDPVRCLGACRW